MMVKRWKKLSKIAGALLVLGLSFDAQASSDRAQLQTQLEQFLVSPALAMKNLFLNIGKKGAIKNEVYILAPDRLVDPAHYTVNGGGVYKQNPEEHDYGEAAGFQGDCTHTLAQPAATAPNPASSLEEINGIASVLFDAAKEAVALDPNHIEAALKKVKYGGSLVIPNCIFVFKVSESYRKLLLNIAKKNHVGTATYLGDYTMSIPGDTITQTLHYPLNILWGDLRSSVNAQGTKIKTNTIFMDKLNSASFNHEVMPESELVELRSYLNEESNGRTRIFNALPQDLQNKLSRCSVYVTPTINMHGAFPETANVPSAKCSYTLQITNN